MAGSDKSLSPRQTEWYPESAVADLRHAVGWDLLGTVPEVPGTRKLFPAEERSESSEHLESERSSAGLEGSSWTVETRAGGPSHCPKAQTWRPWTPPWGPDTAMQTWWGICWRKSRTGRPAVRPTWQTLVGDAPWPSSTRCSVCDWLWTANPPGRCTLLADARELQSSAAITRFFGSKKSIAL